MIRLTDIQQARARIADALYLSPCPSSQTLSARTGCRFHHKLDNLQMTGSFKERGARNKLLTMSAADRARGVIAASAGNHAQGLAFVARGLDCPATIVMPKGTPLIKVSATLRHGAEVILHGDNYDEAAAEATRLSSDRGLTVVHPFDDDAVIAGQGSLGLELLEQLPDLDAVVLPIGGGGLAAGVAIAIKESRPQLKVYGVEPQCLPSMTKALEQGAPVTLSPSKTVADGIAVRCVGERTLEAAGRYLDDIALVDEEEIAEAILLLLEQEKTVAEGAGAAPLAAVLKGAFPLAGKTVAVVLSGGNIDVNLLSRIIERGLMKSGRAVRLKLRVPDVPGSLANLSQIVATAEANVLEISHDRLDATTGVGHSLVELKLETRGFDHVAAIRTALEAAGWRLEE